MSQIAECERCGRVVSHPLSTRLGESLCLECAHPLISDRVSAVSQSRWDSAATTYLAEDDLHWTEGDEEVSIWLARSIVQAGGGGAKGELTLLGAIEAATSIAT